MAFLFERNKPRKSHQPETKYVQPEAVLSTKTSATPDVEGDETAQKPTPIIHNDSRVSNRDRASQLKQSLQSPNGSSPSPIPQTMTWSPHHFNILSSRRNPFPRYSAATNSIASKEGNIYMLGGDTYSLAGAGLGFTGKRGDLWKIENRESSEGGLNCFELDTISVGPSPRRRPACLLVGNAFIVFGGCALSGNDPVDTTLYLLNTRGPPHLNREFSMRALDSNCNFFIPLESCQWYRVISANPLGGRYGHSLSILGSKLYVFGGQNKDEFFNDLVAYDLNQLQNPGHNWERRGRGPPARADHTMVSFDGSLYLFGGRNAQRKFNGIWVYDPQGNAWTKLSCYGPYPAPRSLHAATVVYDVMFLFGGLDDGKDGAGKLFALSITRRRWYSFNTDGASYPRFGHSMTAIGTQIMMMGGKPFGNGYSRRGEFSVAYILDTSGILYDVQSVQIAARDRNSAEQVIQKVLDILSIGQEVPRNPHLSASQERTRRKLLTGKKPWNPPLWVNPFSRPLVGEFFSVAFLGGAGVETQEKTTAGDHGLPAQRPASKQEASLHQKHSVPTLEPTVGHIHSPLAHRSRPAVEFPIPPRIRSAVDLIRDSYRETEVVPGFTKHVVWESNRSAGQRRVKMEELWKREHKLGHGTFGLVWLESCTKGENPGSLRAVKEIAKSTTSTEVKYERELEALAKFSNKNYVHCFVHFFGWWESPTAIFISMEYAPDGDLQKLMTVPFPESITWEIVGQILEGLEFMHENGFTHRDLKPLNILVLQQSPTWWVKITDFGISKRARESTGLHSFVGTQGYIAPEVMDYVEVSDAQDPSYTNAVDIWALGEITFRLITHQSTFPTPGALSRYAAARVPFPYVELDRVGASKEIKQFLEKAMAAQPSQRLSARDARRHPWIGRSRPPSQQPIPNPSLAQKSAEEEENIGEPSNRWSTAFDSRPLTNSPTGV